MAVTENKYQLGTAENQKFLQDVRDGLLSFGHQFPSPGGSSYYLGDDGTPWKDRNRETWITSRMTHVYSIGSMLGHEGSEALADAALKGLRGELHDDQMVVGMQVLQRTMKLFQPSSAMPMHL